MRAKGGADEKGNEYMRATNEGSDGSIERNWWGKITSNTMIINKADPKTVAKDRQDLIDQGWYEESEIKVVDIAWDETFHYPIQSILTVSRQGISSAYCAIPLKVMARFARGEGVDLVISSKLDRRANIILATDSNLQTLEGIIDQYIAANKNKSRPEDWKPEDWGAGVNIGKKAKISRDFLKKMRHAHFHFSASKMSAGYKPNFEWDKSKLKYIRIRYYYNG